MEVQDRKDLNVGAGQGAAVRYFPLENDQEADYLLFVDRKAAGIVEAKPVGTTLAGVAEQSENRHQREKTERFHAFSYDELVERDKVSLDIFWLRDDNLEDPANLPEPHVLAAEIVENRESALDQFRGIEQELEKE